MSSTASAHYFILYSHRPLANMEEGDKILTLESKTSSELAQVIEIS